MDERSAFFRSILENPADDTVRLVFADWLEENGGADRAASIRWLIRTGREFHMVNGEWVYHDRIDRLPADVWRGLNQFTSEPMPVQCIVSRGFVTEVRLSAAAFTVNVARSLFERHPVTGVVLMDRTPERVGSRGRFHWDHEDNGPSSDSARSLVPGAIFWRLKGGEYNDDPDERLRWFVYESARLATSALSDACVGWGRELAGLPPLPAAEQPVHHRSHVG